MIERVVFGHQDPKGPSDGVTRPQDETMSIDTPSHSIFRCNKTMLLTSLRRRQSTPNSGWT
jgi:hypothetical protein